MIEQRKAEVVLMSCEEATAAYDVLEPSHDNIADFDALLSALEKAKTYAEREGEAYVLIKIVKNF
jgi:hypothetical protein